MIGGGSMLKLRVFDREDTNRGFLRMDVGVNLVAGPALPSPAMTMII
jgi:hypothetical protein